MLIGEIVSDVQFATRRLRMRRVFTLTAILVSGLGIGASTAVFSVVDAAVLRPLPFREPDKLVALAEVSVPFAPSGSVASRNPQVIDLLDLASMPELFQDVGVYAAGGLNLTSADPPERLRVGVVTPGFFRTVGARAASGRLFADAEGSPGNARVAVLSHAFWQSRFGGTAIAGKTLSLNGASYTIVGVVPRGFSFPNESEVWIPLTVPMTWETFRPFRGSLPTRVIARLAPGVTRELAGRTLMDRWKIRLSGAGPEYAALLADLQARRPSVPLQQQLVGDRHQALRVIAGATALLLAIAGANLSILLLLDGASRRQEVMLRGALGASRSRICRQLLIESLVIACAGAVVGVIASPLLLQILGTTMPTDLAGVAAPTLSGRALAYAALITVLVGAGAGLWPSVRTTRVGARDVLSISGELRATSAGLGTARRVLLTIEIALSIMLLVGGSLMVRSMSRIVTQDLGMDPGAVAVLELSFSEPTRPSVLNAVSAIVDRLSRERAITGAAVASRAPFGASGVSLAVSLEGGAAFENGRGLVFAQSLAVTGDYFRTLGIPLLRGRSFLRSDVPPAPPVAVISQSMARALWPATDALGKTFYLPNDSARVTVVGVVSDVLMGWEDPKGPQVYLPIEREAPANVVVLARGSTAMQETLVRMQAAVLDVTRAGAVHETRGMRTLLEDASLLRRTSTWLILTFGLAGLTLAGVGVHGVVSHNLALRKRELAVRAALGAGPRHTLGLVAREMARIVIAGTAIGVLGSWWSARLMAAVLFNVDAHDRVSFVSVPLAVALLVFLSAMLPARQAAAANLSESIRVST